MNSFFLTLQKTENKCHVVSGHLRFAEPEKKAGNSQSHSCTSRIILYVYRTRRHRTRCSPLRRCPTKSHVESLSLKGRKNAMLQALRQISPVLRKDDIWGSLVRALSIPAFPSKALVMTEHGAPERVLALIDHPPAHLGEKDILVNILAVGLYLKKKILLTWWYFSWLFEHSSVCLWLALSTNPCLSFFFRLIWKGHSRSLPLTTGHYKASRFFCCPRPPHHPP
jgi:hypothetical protein